MTREEFMNTIANAMQMYPRWRYGQTVWNVAADLFPYEVEPFRGSHIDPFHVDARVDEFLEAIDAVFTKETP